MSEEIAEEMRKMLVSVVNYYWTGAHIGELFDEIVEIIIELVREEE